MKSLAKYAIIFLISGSLYLNMETIFRAVFHQMPEYKYLAFMGFASVWMFFIGGALGMLLGRLNTNKFANAHINIFWQSVLGAIIILAVEFVSGVILNIWLGLNIWSYDGYPLNLLGQICLPFGILWLVLSPFVFWLEDNLRYYFADEKDDQYSLLSIYLAFFNPFAKVFK